MATMVFESKGLEPPGAAADLGGCLFAGAAKTGEPELEMKAISWLEQGERISGRKTSCLRKARWVIKDTRQKN